MKKIINQPEMVVTQMCRGIVMTHTDLEFIEKSRTIKKKVLNPEKVSIISGGGSGHEPAHSGFIGKGLLDGAVCGDTFASPSQIQIYRALKAVLGNKGTLMVVKNYSGDMMNFKSAAHLAEEDGLEVDYIRVDDDIAVKDSLYTVGRRGVAGTVLVHKIVGAAAEKGMALKDVKAVGQKAADNVRSIGFALSSCTVPAKGTPTFLLGENEIEYGVGIHGEPGICREKMISADVLAERMTDALLADLKIEAGANQEIAVLINGFGGTPLQELYLFNYAVVRHLHKKGVHTVRTLVGNYMTSIDMAGASVSIMKLDKELKEMLNFPCESPALNITGAAAPILYTDEPENTQEEISVSFQCETNASFAVIKNEKISLENMIYIVDKMGASIIKNEVAFCELDSHAGDGDFGMSVAKGFKQLKREWKDILKNNKGCIGSYLQDCSLVIMEHCGGASGPIWGSAFRSAAKMAGNKQELTAGEFAEVLQAAVRGIQKTGERSFGRGAVVGDKTLVDALAPCADVWTQSAKAGEKICSIFKKAAEASVMGANKTKEFAARMGRAGTVGKRSIGYPDAGAYALGILFTEIADALK